MNVHVTSILKPCSNDVLCLIEQLQILFIRFGFNLFFSQFTRNSIRSDVLESICQTNECNEKALKNHFRQWRNSQVNLNRVYPLPMSTSVERGISTKVIYYTDSYPLCVMLLPRKSISEYCQHHMIHDSGHVTWAHDKNVNI